MDTKGGRVSIEVGGAIFSPREASVKIKPAQVSIETAANGDGSGYATVKPELASADITFDRGDPGFKWSAGMLLQKANVTIVEIDTGVTHLFTGARWTGAPELDTGSGEVSGLSIAADQYQQI